MKLVKVRQRLLKQRRFRQLLLALFIISILLGIWIVPLEQEVGNIRTVSDGLWWAVTTITSTGYGDHFPVTDPGRLIGAVLQILGVVILGLLVAVIGTSMNRSQEEFYWDRLFERMNELELEVRALRRRSEFLIKGESTDKESIE